MRRDRSSSIDPAIVFIVGIGLFFLIGLFLNHQLSNGIAYVLVIILHMYYAHQSGIPLIRLILILSSLQAVALIFSLLYPGLAFTLSNIGEFARSVGFGSILVYFLYKEVMKFQEFEIMVYALVFAIMIPMIRVVLFMVHFEIYWLYSPWIMLGVAALSANLLYKFGKDPELSEFRNILILILIWYGMDIIYYYSYYLDIPRDSDLLGLL